MRIAVFIKSTTFHKGFGGLETQNRILCEGLVKQGHEVVVYSPAKEITDTKKTLEGVLYVFVSCIYKYGIFSEYDKRNWVNVSYEAFISDHLEKKYDIVIGQSSAAVGVIRHKKEVNIKVLSISHGTILGEYETSKNSIHSVKDFFRFMFDCFYVFRNFFGRQREFIYGSDKIVAVSNFVKNSLIDETFVPEDFIEVIHNGIDFPPYESMGKISLDPVKIIYVGRVLRSKGLFNLLESLAKVQNANWRLTVCGDGIDLNLLKFCAGKLNIDNKINFTGVIPKDTVVKELCASDIFVLPSLRFEGFPMTLVEAMFANLPIIASDIGGISDAVTHGVNGYLVKSGDIIGFAEKIEHLISNKDLRIELGNNGKMRAVAEFTQEVMVKKYINLIGKLI